MRILGIDPGSRICGYGVIESDAGVLAHIESGAITVPQSLEIPLKLRTIYEELRTVIDRTRPECMSIENVFFAKNARSSLKLGEARGVAILVAGLYDMPVYEYAPTQIKLTLTGKGRANKDEIRELVSIVFGIESPDKTDISDAIAIALCHAHQSEAKSIFGTERTGRRRKRKRFTLNDISS